MNVYCYLIKLFEFILIISAWNDKYFNLKMNSDKGKFQKFNSDKFFLAFAIYFFASL